MIDLRAFFLENVTEDDYYYYFYSLVQDVNKTNNVFDGEQVTEDFQFLVFDEDEAIEVFRSLCRPSAARWSHENYCWFYVVAYYLNECGYCIDQFPQVLSRPPRNPDDFVYSEIRDRAIALGLDNGGTVQWSTRRQIVAEMTFTRKGSSLVLKEDLDQMMQLISTRNARFEEMEADEKLCEIVNLIEHLLKTNGRFIQLDYSKVMLGYVDEEAVKKYKKQLQCFRHSSAESLAERAGFTDAQKTFLIDYGVTICKAIYSLIEIEQKER